jgi:hypothetical protein
LSDESETRDLTFFTLFFLVVIGRLNAVIIVCACSCRTKKKKRERKNIHQGNDIAVNEHLNQATTADGSGGRM